uniref:DNA repair protein XRCC2 homolog n=1 Tax=Rhizophora mucronata TaxID=61149 RepID=A0A2P2JX82_RHIMU
MSGVKMALEVEAWIDGDESAKDMLSRVVLTEKRPLLLLPLRGFPLRPGNVVELVGPSPSAKTHILMQAAIDCILPEEWNGVHYGGLGRLVMFIDLDCRFDVLRLSHMLKNRIMEANGSSNNVDHDKSGVTICNGRVESRPTTAFDDKLFVACMRRFLHVRCYDSLEFLSVLKVWNSLCFPVIMNEMK